MIGQAKPKPPQVLQPDKGQGKMPANLEGFIEIDAETKFIADPSQEEITPQKPKKSGRSPKSLLRWSIYSLLGFGVVGLFLPTFLYQATGGCASKARSSEGKTYVGSMNRGQQAFWIENGNFGKSIPVLELGIQEETTNYKYEVQGFKLVTYQYAIPKNDKAKSFVGAVFVLPDRSQKTQGLDRSQSEPKQLATFAIVCESPETGVKTKLPKPFLNNGEPTCAEGTNLIN